MTEEEITEIAKDISLSEKHEESMTLFLKAFARLVAEQERAACAELIPPQYFEFRDRIRARGQE